MPRNIEQQVAENTDKRRRLESYNTSVNNEGDKLLSLTGLFIETTASVSVDERDLGNTMVVGHPDAEHSVGRGGSGDNREPWAQAAGGSADTETTNAGRPPTAAVIGGVGPLEPEVSTGSDGSPPDQNDESLGSESHRGAATRLVSNGTDASYRAEYRFHEHGGSEEAGLLLSGVLAARASPGAGAGRGAETRVGVSLSFDGRGRGGASFTAAGEEHIASLMAGADGPLDRVFLVTDINEEPGKVAERVVSGRSISLNVRFFVNEPGYQPFDVTAVRVGSEPVPDVISSSVDPFEKNEDRAVDVTVGVRVV